MSLLGRLSGLGRALIARGLAGIGLGPSPASSIVEVCVTRPFYAGPAIVRAHYAIPVTREVSPSIDVRRPVAPSPRVTRPVPSC